MRFHVTWALAFADFFDVAKYNYRCGFGGCGGSKGNESHVATEQEQCDSHGIPDPAIT
jgi:hypothetical protein